MEWKQRKERIRRKIKKLNEQKLPRLCIYRSGLNFYSQLIDYNTGNILAEASTLSKEFKESKLKSYNVEGAKFVGQIIGEKIKNKNINQVIFDRSGYKFHGRVKSFVDSVKEFIKI